MGDSTITTQTPGGGAGNQTNNATTTPSVTDTTKTDAGTGAAIDTSKFTQADWDRIYNDPKLYEHNRFKSLNDQAKEAKQLREEKEAATKKQLEEEKRYQELATLNENKAKDWQTRAETASVNSEIIREAVKQGVVDPDAAVKLIDRKDVKLNDDGTVSGVADAVKAMVKDKPYLVGKGNQNLRLGGGSAPSDTDTTTPRFKHSQLKDPAFFRKHEKEINEAIRLNLVVDDLAPGAQR